MNRILLVLTIFAFALASRAQQNSAKGARPAKPADDSQGYSNAAIGFRYRIPYGWVDRTKEMQQQDEQNVPSASATKQEASKGEVLLAVFERPPRAAGDTVNSAVVIASESAATYPGLKSAEDYLGPLNELTSVKGFKADGDPQEVTIDSRSLVRADFSKALTDKLTMYQSTLLMLEKKQILSFTFIAGSKDEVDELIDALTFQGKATGKAK